MRWGKGHGDYFWQTIGSPWALHRARIAGAVFVAIPRADKAPTSELTLLDSKFDAYEFFDPLAPS
jgi:hypothetical protein